MRLRVWYKKFLSPCKKCFWIPDTLEYEKKNDQQKSLCTLDKLFFANDEFDSVFSWERNTKQNKDDYAGGSPILITQRCFLTKEYPPSKYSLPHPESMYLEENPGNDTTIFCISSTLLSAFQVSLSATCSEILKKITLVHELEHKSEKCVKIHWGICWWWSIQALEFSIYTIIKSQHILSWWSVLTPPKLNLIGNRI